MSRDENELLKAERHRMGAAFDDVLKEPVPDRLKALLAEPAAPAVDLSAWRAQRRGMSNWAAWGGMAAAVVLGTVLGTRLAPSDGDGLDRGRLVATGSIAHALEGQLASTTDGPVAVQISFRAKDGRYCRSFSAAAAAGLACREADGVWALQQVAAVAPSSSAGMRQATSALPPALLTAIDANMAGPALNADQEKAARDAGWR